MSEAVSRLVVTDAIVCSSGISIFQATLQNSTSSDAPVSARIWNRRARRSDRQADVPLAETKSVTAFLKIKVNMVFVIFIRAGTEHRAKACARARFKLL